jgi:hypothetical protein
LIHRATDWYLSENGIVYKVIAPGQGDFDQFSLAEYVHSEIPDRVFTHPEIQESAPQELPRIAGDGLKYTGGESQNY